MKERRSKVENNVVVEDNYSKLTLRADIDKYKEIYLYLKETLDRLTKSKEFEEYELGKIMVNRIMKYSLQINYLFPINKFISDRSNLYDVKIYLRKYKENLDKLDKILEKENELIRKQMQQYATMIM